MSTPYELSDDMPVYVISVAAQLSGMHPQTLRAYDRLGLVSPGRSQGRGRRYSMRDILALREIQRLSREGINLNGIKLLLEQHRELEQARRLIAELTLGAEVKVPSHRGAPVTVRIPPGTPNGRTFMVRGKGVRRKDGTTGNMLVTVDVMVPTDLNSKARSSSIALREATAGQDPREELLERAKEA